MSTPSSSSRSTMAAMFVDVQACTLPEQSTLAKRIDEHDFIDCFRVNAQATPRRAAEIITSFPAWADFLFLIRRVVTSPFGLSQDGPDAPDKLGAFPVESDNEQELIAGFDDKHQEFRVSVMSLENQIYLATWVHTHNIGGRIYLRAILPFHTLLVREALVRVQQNCQE